MVLLQGTVDTSERRGRLHVKVLLRTKANSIWPVNDSLSINVAAQTDLVAVNNFNLIRTTLNLSYTQNEEKGNSIVWMVVESYNS